MGIIICLYIIKKNIYIYGYIIYPYIHNLIYRSLVKLVECMCVLMGAFLLGHYWACKHVILHRDLSEGARAVTHQGDRQVLCWSSGHHAHTSAQAGRWVVPRTEGHTCSGSLCPACTGHSGLACTCRSHV